MIALHKHSISGQIVDRYAKIKYYFDFENTHQDGSTELKFEITIDTTAFISKFEALIDGELFIGQTKEKETALNEYNEAKERDENTILIFQPHQDIPNVFQIRTNIDAKSKISLTIQIEQYLQKVLTFNHCAVQILRNFNKYGIKCKFAHISFMFKITDQSVIYDIDVPRTNMNDMIVHHAFTDKMNTRCTIDGQILNNSSVNELIFKYKTKGEQAESQLLFDSKSNTFCHVLCDIMHQMNTEVNEGFNLKDWTIPRRVIFVIDRSGSMRGSKWDKTISSTIMALKQLTPFDRFGIIVFNDSMELLPSKLLDTTACVMANDEHIADAIHTLQHVLSPSGRTNINDALLKAIQLIKNDITKHKYNLFINQMIVITDGEPNDGERDTTQIVQNVITANDLKDKISIFAFGVGQSGNDSAWIKDLNHSFLKILSVNNKGFYRRIRQSTADAALSQYFEMLSRPMLVNVNLKYKDKNIHSLTKTRFNAFYAGNDVIICGQIDRKAKDKELQLRVEISATTGQTMAPNDGDVAMVKAVTVTKTIQITIDTETQCKPHVEKTWAYLKLQQYAQEKLIYDDMIDEEESKEHESVPLALALKCKLVTPWTSMIVVKKKSKMDTNQKWIRKARKKTKRMELHEYATATLGAGNMREAVRLPKGEELNDWLAVHVVDAYNEISLLYGVIQPFCTDATCPVMSAGPKYEYLWVDGKAYSAPQYVKLLMEWVAALVNDNTIFPAYDGAPYPSQFGAIVKTIWKRLFRVFAHIYHHHMKKMIELDAEAHLNTCFKHFIYFVKEFKMVHDKELAPLSDTINRMLHKDVQKNSYKSKYQYK